MAEDEIDPQKLLYLHKYLDDSHFTSISYTEKVFD